MVNLLRLSALFAYDLRPISYKPIPVSDPVSGVSTASASYLNASVPRAFGAAYIQRRASLAGYDLHSIGYKPIPGADAGTAPTASRVPPPASDSGSGQSQSSFSSPRVQGAGVAYIQQDPAKKNATTTAVQSGGSEDSSEASCKVDPYDAPPVLDQESPPYDQTTANVYRYRQQRSVNLGSWFVHESWMTPSVFKCAAEPKLAEIDIANGWSTQDAARAVLERHWDTFIQESDFEYLANIGINTVRLPIGYWSLGPDFLHATAFEPVAQVYTNAWPRVMRAINQAGKTGMGVLVDLHGAVGSQNGQPHSGVSDGKTNLFTVPENMDKTLTVLTYLAQQLALVNNVVGIQILNEPQYGDGLTDFYSRAIDAIRAVSPSAKTIPLYLHDGFDLAKFSTYVAGRTDFVVQDHHSYFVFSPSDQTESGSQHTVDVKGAISKSLLDVSKKQHRNIVVDEWSCALTPQSLEKDSDASEVRKNFCTDQMAVYTNASAGWGFWSYKKEDCNTDPGWCFTAAVGKTLPATFFTYGKAASMQDVSTLAKNISDTLIIPTVTTEILNLIQPNMQSTLSTEAGGSLQLQDTLVPRHRQRFDAIHHRRGNKQNATSSGAGASGSGKDTNNMKDSTSKGYTDGFTTAKVFASYNMSQLGFTGQFMNDAIRVAGSTLIAVGTEGGYHGGFMQGLKDGEKLAAGSY